MFVIVKKPFYAYKKVRGCGIKCGNDEVIVKLLIPKGATVYTDCWDAVNAIENRKQPWTVAKMRASVAEVVSLTRLSTKRKYTGEVCPVSILNTGYRYVRYAAGRVVKPHAFSRADEQCAGGIHFFVDRNEAVYYLS